MIVVCCRCNNVGAELDDELFEDDGGGTLPLMQPVPDGWYPTRTPTTARCIRAA